MLKLNRFFFDQAISIDNALTTNQIIHQIIKQVKEVVDYVNSLETDAHEYTDTKVLELKTQLEHQISELETFLIGYADTKLVDAKNYTDSEIANLRLNYIDVKISEIYETITALETRLDAKIDYTDAKLTNLIDSVKSELLELIKKGGAIYSGYSGELVSVQEELKMLWSVFSKLGGLTWDVFDTYFKYYNYAYYKNMIDDIDDVTGGNTLKINNIVFEFGVTSGIGTATITHSSVNEQYTLTFTTNLSTTKVCNACIFNFRQGLTTVPIPITNEVVDEDYNRIVLIIPDTLINNSNFMYGQFVRTEGGSYVTWGAGLRVINGSDTVNKPQALTWSTIEMIQDLTSDGLTYNLVTFDFLTNFDNLLKVIDYTDSVKERFMTTMTNYVYFSNIVANVQNANKIVESSKISINAQRLLSNFNTFI